MIRNAKLNGFVTLENIYLYIIILLGLLAIGDLIVGVSNDAVNFLNSAIGSKAISFRNIMIFASLGIALGALFSSGMMEVARKGIFNPSAFSFEEIIDCFKATEQNVFLSYFQSNFCAFVLHTCDTKLIVILWPRILALI